MNTQITINLSVQLIESNYLKLRKKNKVKINDLRCVWYKGQYLEIV